MLRFVRLLILVLMLGVGFVPSNALAEFDFSLMVDDLNLSARSDMSQFNMEVASEFGLRVGTVDRLVQRLGTPGDAYMCLKVGALTGRSVDEVVRARKVSAGEGWGKTAQRMGIKPGSAAFKQLKQKPEKKFKAEKKSKKNKQKGKKNR